MAGRCPGISNAPNSSTPGPPAVPTPPSPVSASNTSPMFLFQPRPPRLPGVPWVAHRKTPVTSGRWSLLARWRSASWQCSPPGIRADQAAPLLRTGPLPTPPTIRGRFIPRPLLRRVLRQRSPSNHITQTAPGSRWAISAPRMSYRPETDGRVDLPATRNYVGPGASFVLIYPRDFLRAPGESPRFRAPRGPGGLPQNVNSSVWFPRGLLIGRRRSTKHEECRERCQIV